MASARRAIVIGAGAAGLSAAAYLAKDGYDVLALEKAPRLGGVPRRRGAASLKACAAMMPRRASARWARVVRRSAPRGRTHEPAHDRWSASCNKRGQECR